jgi:hypothetical protein
MCECKRSTLFMNRVSQGSMLGVFLYKLSTDEEGDDFRRSKSTVTNDYLRKQEKYWANRMIWC